MCFQVFGKGNKPDRFLLRVDFSNQVVEPPGPFKPPMAEKFSIVRRHDDGLAIHNSGQIFNLLFPVEHKVPRVEFGFSLCPFRNIDFFVIALASYAEIFEAGVHPNTVTMNVRLNVINIEIVGNVSIKFPVVIIPGIAFCRTPDLFGRFRVATKSGYS